VTRAPEETVRSFCAAWSRLDLDEITSYFTEDVVYHNMPGPAVTGGEAVRGTIARFLSTWNATTWEVRNLAVAGDTVLTERVDRIDAGGRHVDLPVAGVFELEGDRIRAWRDYFDLGAYTRAISGG